MSTYKAFVAEITATKEIPGADFIHTAFVMGDQVVVSKDWDVGKVGLFFPADTQLTHDFCVYNNLYRDSTQNRDNEKKGFFDANRRVRCQPFKKTKSEGFFCELSALDYMPHVPALDVGMSFDEIDGIPICKKYVNPATKNKQHSGPKKKERTIEAPNFHKHVDTDQFKYYVHKIPTGALLHFHAKVHGTSGRYSLSKVVRKPTTFWEKMKDKVGLFTRETWEYIVGTRNVTLFEGDRTKEGFHGSEEYRFEVLDMLRPFLEKNMIVYGEIAGYANGKPIMPNHHTKSLSDKKFKKKYGEEITYAYGCKEHEFRFHVYRISFVNEDGKEVDLSDAQCKEWCARRGILYAHAVHEPVIFNGDYEWLQELVEELTERPDVLTEDYIAPDQISEGIVLRVEDGSFIPEFYKNKSFAFKVMEGIAKESGEVDPEEAS